MIKNKTLEQKFNEAAVEFAISSYGRCKEMKDDFTVTQAALMMKSEDFGCVHCPDVATCSILRGFDDFRAGSEWLFDMAKSSLAEVFLSEQIL